MIDFARGHHSLLVASSPWLIMEQPKEIEVDISPGSSSSVSTLEPPSLANPWPDVASVTAESDAQAASAAFAWLHQVLLRSETSRHMDLSTRRLAIVLKKLLFKSWCTSRRTHASSLYKKRGQSNSKAYRKTLKLWSLTRMRMSKVTVAVIVTATVNLSQWRRICRRGGP